MNYVVDKVKGGVKRGCVHFDTPSTRFSVGEVYMIYHRIDTKFW